MLNVNECIIMNKRHVAAAMLIEKLPPHTSNVQIFLVFQIFSPNNEIYKIIKVAYLS